MHRIEGTTNRVIVLSAFRLLVMLIVVMVVVLAASMTGVVMLPFFFRHNGEDSAFFVSTSKKATKRKADPEWRERRMLRKKWGNQNTLLTPAPRYERLKWRRLHCK
jgi:hypothetical protein